MEFFDKMYSQDNKIQSNNAPMQRIKLLGNQTALKLSQNSPNNIIQRKIGMEFQTVGGEDNIVPISKVHRDPQEEPLLERELFSLTIDGNDLEYVTEAQELNDGQLLLAAVKEIVATHNQVTSKSNPDVNEKLKGYGYEINLNGMKDAHPQATVGVILESIPELIDSLLKNLYGGSIPTKKSSDREEIKKVHQKEFELMADYILQKKISDKKNLVGLLQLIAQYKASERIRSSEKKIKFIQTKYEDLPAAIQNIVIIVCAKYSFNTEKGLAYIIQNPAEFEDQKQDILHFFNNQIAGKYSKSYMPFMSRTALNSLFSLLSEEEQVLFLEMTEQHPDVVIMSKGSKEAATNTSEPLKMKDLQLLREDRDLIAESGFFGVSELYVSGSNYVPQHVKDSATSKMRKFKVNTPDDIGMGMKGSIMELRGLPRNINPDKWESLTGAIIRLVEGLNRPHQ